MKLILDLLLLAIIVLCAWTGYKKGLIMGIAALLAAIISLYGASLVSQAYSYEVVPVLRPFVSGYIQNRMENEVLEDLGIDDTSLSVEDVLSGDPSLRHDFCAACYASTGIYADAADQMATEAEEYAAANGATIQESVVEVFCIRAAYVAGVALVFIVFLIALTALGNIPNLSFKIPNMDTLNDAGGAVMGLVNGMVYCILLCWALRFLGLVIGRDTLENTILAKFFISIDFITSGVGI